MRLSCCPPGAKRRQAKLRRRRKEGAVNVPAGWRISPAGWIPSAVELGKQQGDLTDAEASFLASHESLIALQLFGRQYPYIEDGVKANVAKIKKANAKATVLYYWGFRGTGHKNYRVYADSGFKPAWYVQKAGQKNHTWT